ncbi:hypothetical protein [Paraburkholderia sediminicola]|uniref:hypothetical protein n=1 Tax=Paraburkholderia sediminicola TaxID=458836 RepID=UPI0038B76C08
MEYDFNANLGLLVFWLNDLEALADYLGISSRHLRSLLKSGVAPERYAAKLLDIGDLVLFPLDEPPGIAVIGDLISRAFEGLRTGDEELAESFSMKALSPQFIDWRTGDQAKLTPLQRFYARLANGISWTRNRELPREHSATEHGLPALRLLRRDVCAHIKAQKINHHTWANLSAITHAYWLTYGAKFLVDPRCRTRAARRIVRKCAPSFRKHRTVFANKHVASLIAWNLAQYAAVAAQDEHIVDTEDVEFDQIFIEALDVLSARYDDRDLFKLIVTELDSDDDTKLMLKKDSVQKHVASLLLQPNDDEADPLTTN